MTQYRRDEKTGKMALVVSSTFEYKQGFADGVKSNQDMLDKLRAAWDANVEATARYNARREYLRTCADPYQRTTQAPHVEYLAMEEAKSNFIKVAQEIGKSG